MSPQFKVGGEVDVVCTKCKLTLAHTILALVDGVPAKVRCNTCKSEHVYRDPNRKRSPARRSRASRPSGSAESEATWQRLVGEAGSSPKRRYNMYERFEAGELLDHPAFGLGVVTGGIGNSKVEVAFRSGQKVLVHQYRG